ncbi:MAG: 3-hydroxyacyl-ACP dehydratase [Saprospiraceae bacterium]|nr:3-hydroxyacyl-ACP dehydratase [Saprospiraceae bacterium]
MLVDDFFIIKTIQNDAGKSHARLRLNADHAIFQGHFPGTPVVPGVCMVQMLKELVETSLGLSLQLEKAPMIKFLAILQPAQHPEIDAVYDIADLPEGKVQVSGQITDAELTFFKFKGIFHAQS